MKSKALFFNRHIIIENLKRFWGIGALYTLVLCLTGVFPILMIYDTLTKDGHHEVTTFLKNETFFCYLFLISAPIAAAVLIFRYMQQNHATAVIHAFPFTRKQLFVNHCISGVLLILVPILVNTIILLIIKKPVYEYDIPIDFFSASAIGNWALQSTLIVLVGFSIAVFAGIISGSSILQMIFGFGFLFIAPATIFLFVYYFDRFLFGFITTPKLEQIVIYLSPIAYKISSSYETFFDANWIIWYIALTLILFVLSYWLYTKRHLERATEPIAFEWLKPIFKYCVTFCGMILLGAYLMELGESETMSISVYAGFFIGSLLSYIIAEMVVQKSIWVFKNLKGYFVFLIIATVFIVFIQTDVLGYEKRLPDISKVESIYIGSSLYEMNDNLGLLKTRENIEQGYLYHQSIIDNKKVLEKDIEGHYDYVNIKYNYSNGRNLIRRYRLSQEFLRNNPYMQAVFESEEYKLKDPIFKVDMSLVDYLDIYPVLNSSRESIRIIDRNEINEFWCAYKNDFLNEPYKEHCSTLKDLGQVHLGWKPSKKQTVDDLEEDYVYYDFPAIKQTYTETIEWLTAHGYMDKMIVKAEDVSYVTVTNYLDEGEYRKEMSYRYNPSFIPEATENRMVITDKEDIQTILTNIEKNYYHIKGTYKVTVVFNQDAEDYLHNGYFHQQTPQVVKNYFD